MRPTITASTVPCGKLAFEIMGIRLPLKVMRSARGFYLGTSDETGPISRESHEYWLSADEAQSALKAGPCAWTQRDEP